MGTGSRKPAVKQVITPSIKREAERGRRDLALGRGISMDELLARVRDVEGKKRRKKR